MLRFSFCACVVLGFFLSNLAVVNPDGTNVGEGMSESNAWGDDKLYELGMVRLTEKLYDEVVHNSKDKWLVVFSQDWNKLVTREITKRNQLVQVAISEIRKDDANLKIAYCDVLFFGYMIGKTFDI